MCKGSVWLNGIVSGCGWKCLFLAVAKIAWFEPSLRLWAESDATDLYPGRAWNNAIRGLFQTLTLELFTFCTVFPASNGGWRRSLNQGLEKFHWGTWGKVSLSWNPTCGFLQNPTMIVCCNYLPVILPNSKQRLIQYFENEFIVRWRKVLLPFWS